MIAFIHFLNILDVKVQKREKETAVCLSRITKVPITMNCGVALSVSLLNV